jgi:hypothetical protein
MERRMNLRNRPWLPGLASALAILGVASCAQADDGGHCALAPPRIQRSKVPSVYVDKVEVSGSETRYFGRLPGASFNVVFNYCESRMQQINIISTDGVSFETDELLKRVSNSFAIDARWMTAQRLSELQKQGALDFSEGSVSVSAKYYQIGRSLVLSLVIDADA